MLPCFRMGDEVGSPIKQSSDLRPLHGLVGIAPRRQPGSGETKAVSSSICIYFFLHFLESTDTQEL